MIRVRPAATLRREFATWGVAQRPKLRHIGGGEFAVPSSLFTYAPEELLLGAVVDGHPYVPVAEAAGDEPPRAGATEALRPPAAPAVPDREDGRGGPVRDSAPDTADTLPDMASDTGDGHALTSEDTGPDKGTDTSDTGGGHVCPHDECGRRLRSARGLTAHLRQAHEGGADSAG